MNHSLDAPDIYMGVELVEQQTAVLPSDPHQVDHASGVTLQEYRNVVHLIIDHCPSRGGYGVYLNLPCYFTHLRKFLNIILYFYGFYLFQSIVTILWLWY